MNTEVREAGKTIWKWLPTHDPIEQADMIFILGNKSDALPIEAASLFKQNLAPWIVVTGGYGRITKNDALTEADRYMEALRSLEVPEGAIIVERESTNTGENISFTQKLLAAKGHDFKKAIAVTTAMLSRRHQATLHKFWPPIEWMVHTPTPMPFEERLSQDNPKEFFDLMVGEVDRLQKYPLRGFMDKIVIPQNVLGAQHALIKAGHTKYIVPHN